MFAMDYDTWLETVYQAQCDADEALTDEEIEYLKEESETERE